MTNAKMIPLLDHEIDWVVGGAMDGEAGWRWLVPPRHRPSPGSGNPPVITPGNALPLLF
jgi:hypothetical protein